MPNRVTTLLIILALSVVSCGIDIPEEVERELANLDVELGFNSDIQGILSDKCYACHGPDKAARMANLDLSTAEGAASALKKGRKESSELFRRLISSNPEERMPPPASNHLLSAKEIALIGRWIDEGSSWEDHWAYIKPEAQEPPLMILMLLYHTSHQKEQL